MRSYDVKMVAYRDQVGKVHTPIAVSKAIEVLPGQVDRLTGIVADTLVGQGLPREQVPNAETRSWLGSDQGRRCVGLSHLGR